MQTIAIIALTFAAILPYMHLLTVDEKNIKFPVWPYGILTLQAIGCTAADTVYHKPVSHTILWLITSIGWGMFTLLLYSRIGKEKDRKKIVDKYNLLREQLMYGEMTIFEDEQYVWENMNKWEAKELQQLEKMYS